MADGPVTREELASVAGTVARVGTAVERLRDQTEAIPVLRVQMAEMRRDLIGDGDHARGLMSRVATIEAHLATLTDAIHNIDESQKRLTTLIETIGARNLEEHQALMTRMAKQAADCKLKATQQDAKIEANTEAWQTFRKVAVAVITAALISLMASVGGIILKNLPPPK